MRRPCACGGVVEADPLDPQPRVMFHVLTEPHRSWSDATSLIPRETHEPPLVPTALPQVRDVSGPGWVRPFERRLAVGYDLGVGVSDTPTGRDGRPPADSGRRLAVSPSAESARG